MRGLDAEVLIVGGGLAAQRCCEALRRLGFDERIALLCEEPCAPYDRPPLSKAFITGDEALPQPTFKPRSWYVENEVELLLGLSARELDVAGRRVVVGESSGRALRYRRLVIATGSRPRKLEGIPPGRNVHELRTHADALSLRAALREGSGRLAILGAGLIGMEVASSARALGLEVTMIEAGATPLGRVLPSELGHWLACLHRRQGVDVRLASCVRAMGRRGEVATLDLSDGSTVRADTVLIAAGSVPATEWLAGSGLGSGPIHTDAGGHTGIPNIYAAGDAACFPDPYSGERRPTPHWEAAVRQGVAVAHSIVGMEPRPAAPTMFWSDQHDRRIQFVGHAPTGCEIELDHGGGEDSQAARTEIRLDQVANAPFAAWIRHDGQPVAAMLVNRPELLGRARRWIADASVNTTRRAA